MVNQNDQSQTRNRGIDLLKNRAPPTIKSIFGSPLLFTNLYTGSYKGSKCLLSQHFLEW